MDMVQIETEILEQIYREVEKRFATIDDLAHGWEHVDRVYTLALHIARAESANAFIVGSAALMHDLGRTMSKNHSNQHHADLSVMLARDILDQYNVSSEQQEAILHAISAHSFSRGIAPRTLEARVVRDADRIDGLGAIGVARWAITGTMRRRADTKLYHEEDPFAERHTPDDQQYMLDHFYTKLLKLSDTMSTGTGQVLARRRTDFMRSYLEELKRELALQ